MKEKRFQKIYIEITNKCNLKCAFCPDTVRAKGFMSCEDFAKVIEKISPYTNLVYLHVKGEPLMHPDFDRILKICEEHGTKVNLTTNGTLLKNKVDAILNSKAVRQINISIHSIKQNENNESYNVDTYIKNIFEVVDRIEKEQRILISYRLWTLKDINKASEDREIIDIFAKKYNMNDLYERAEKSLDVKLAPYIYLNQDREFTWPSLKSDIISETGKCFGLRNQIAILVNGDIVPCCLDNDGDITLGNIFEESIEEILNKDRSRKMIEGFQSHKVVEELCKRCGFRSRFGNQ